MVFSYISFVDSGVISMVGYDFPPGMYKIPEGLVLETFKTIATSRVLNRCMYVPPLAYRF
jgi:hypothetical protein